MTPPLLPLSEIPNAFVVDAARRFREAAENLFAQLRTERFVLPVMVLGGFALELYLKSLNTNLVAHAIPETSMLGFQITASPARKGHSLVDLFDHLDPTIQKDLHDIYAAKRVVEGQASLRDALMVFHCVFEQSRYLFEKPNPSSWCLTDLMRLTRLVGEFVEALPRRMVFAS